MAVNMDTLDKAPASIGLMDGFPTQQMSDFFTKGILRFIGRSARALPDTVVEQAIHMVYIPTKTKVDTGFDIVDTSSSATNAPTLALEQPVVTLGALAILGIVAAVAASAFVKRARRLSRHTAAQNDKMAAKAASDLAAQTILEFVLFERKRCTLEEQRILLTNACTAKDAEIAVLQSKAEEHAAEITAATTAATTAKETLESLQKKTKRVSKDAKLREETAQTISDEKDEKIRDLAAEVEGLKTSAHNVGVELGGLRKKSKALDDAIFKIKSLETAAATSRSESEEKLTAAQLELAAVRKEKGEAIAALQAAQQSAEEKHAAVLSSLETARLTKEKQQLATEQAAAAKIAALEEKLAEATGITLKLKSAVKEGEEANKVSRKALEESKKALESANASLKSGNEELLATNEQLAGEKKRLNTAIESLVNNNISAVQQKVETESALANSKATIESLVSTQEELKSANETLKSDAAKERAEFESTKVEWNSGFERLVSTHALLKSSNQTLNDSNACVLQEKAELESALKKMTAARNALTPVIMGLKKEKAELEAASRTSEGRRETIAAAHAQTLSRQTVLEDENVELQSRVKKLSEQIEEMGSEVEGPEEERDAPENDDDEEAECSSLTQSPPPSPPASGTNGAEGPQHDVADDYSVNGSADEQHEHEAEGYEEHEQGSEEKPEEPEAALGNVDDGEHDDEQGDDEEEDSASRGGESSTTNSDAPHIKRPRTRGRKKITGAIRLQLKALAAAATTATGATTLMRTGLIPTDLARQPLSGSATPFTAASTSRTPIRPAGPATHTPWMPVPTGPRGFVPTAPAQFNLSPSARLIPTGPARPTLARRTRPVPTGPANSGYDRPARQVDSLSDSIWAARGSAPLSSERKR